MGGHSCGGQEPDTLVEKLVMMLHCNGSEDGQDDDATVLSRLKPPSKISQLCYWCRQGEYLGDLYGCTSLLPWLGGGYEAAAVTIDGHSLQDPT